MYYNDLSHWIRLVSTIYRIVGKFGGGKFGESFGIRQTKTIQISTYN